MSVRYSNPKLISDKHTKQKFKFWQQIEPRSRTNDFSQSIQAKIHDPLWMLTRQWQMGEFQAESAGSPIKTRIKYSTTKLTRIKLGKNPVAKLLWKNTDTQIPIEPIIKQENSTSILNDKLKMNWRERVKIGQQFEDMLKKSFNSQSDSRISNSQINDVISEFRKDNNFKISIPNDEKLDNETNQFIKFMKDKSIDGLKLIEYIKSNSDNNLPRYIGEDLIESTRSALNDLKTWVEEFYIHDEQSNESAWQPERLEYEFSVSAPLDNSSDPKQEILTSTDYKGGELDWYHFSKPQNSPKLVIKNGIEPNVFSNEKAEETIPTNLVFKGMPNHRWWKFENRQTDFGKLDVRTTDLGKLLLMDFALISGNDWFIIPLTLDIGTLTKVLELEVKDVFGDVTTINHAGSDNSEKWNMFNISKHQNKINGEMDYLFLPPTFGKIEESSPLEEVKFIRDQMANMAFSIETLITNGIGNTLTGSEEYVSKMNDETNNTIQYRLSTGIPNNWFPWLPIHQDNKNRAIQFRKSIMMNSMDDAPEPKSHILKSLGNDARLNEEAISRASIKIQISNCRARWIDGTTYVFLNKRVKPGTGEGSSGLRYDTIDE